MNGIAEVREQYKEAVREFLRQARTKGGIESLNFYEGMTVGLSRALGCLGVSADEIQEIYALCGDELAQQDLGPGDVSYDEDGFVIEKEELDAGERPVAQAKVEMTSEEWEQYREENKEEIAEWEEPWEEQI